MDPRHPNTHRTNNLTQTDQKDKPRHSTFRRRAHQIAPTHIPRPEAERLLALADFLPISDALVVRELLGAGRTVSHVARLLGVSRHRIRSRVNRLLNRTRDPAFRFVVSRRLRFPAGNSSLSRAAPRLAWPDEWPEPTRIAAQLCILDGNSCRDAARRANLSYHVLRRQISLLRELGRVWRSASAPRETP